MGWITKQASDQMWRKLAMALGVKLKDSGPKYSVSVVSRDTFNNTEPGDEYEGRLVVDALVDQDGGAYLIVTKAVKQPGEVADL